MVGCTPTAGGRDSNPALIQPWPEATFKPAGMSEPTAGRGARLARRGVPADPRDIWPEGQKGD